MWFEKTTMQFIVENDGQKYIAEVPAVKIMIGRYDKLVTRRGRKHSYLEKLKYRDKNGVSLFNFLTMELVVYALFLIPMYIIWGTIPTPLLAMLSIPVIGVLLYPAVVTGYEYEVKDPEIDDIISAAKNGGTIELYNSPWSTTVHKIPKCRTEFAYTIGHKIIMPLDGPDLQKVLAKNGKARNHRISSF